MVLQPTRRTAEEYCYPRGGLLPRLLTLTLAGGYFLLRYYTLSDIKPLTCVVLYIARTFLFHHRCQRWSAYAATKVVKKSQKMQNHPNIDATNCRPHEKRPLGSVHRTSSRMVYYGCAARCGLSREVLLNLLELYILRLCLLLASGVCATLLLLSLLRLLLSIDILRCCLPSGVESLDR